MGEVVGVCARPSSPHVGTAGVDVILTTDFPRRQFLRVEFLRVDVGRRAWDTLGQDGDARPPRIVKWSRVVTKKNFVLT